MGGFAGAGAASTVARGGLVESGDGTGPLIHVTLNIIYILVCLLRLHNYKHFHNGGRRKESK